MVAAGDSSRNETYTVCKRLSIYLQVQCSFMHISLSNVFKVVYIYFCFCALRPTYVFFIVQSVLKSGF